VTHSCSHSKTEQQQHPLIVMSHRKTEQQMQKHIAFCNRTTDQQQQKLNVLIHKNRTTREH